MISEAELLALLTEWRAEIDSVPAPELVTTEQAVELITEQAGAVPGEPGAGITRGRTTRRHDSV
jgi:hypothetical protein